MCTSSASAGVSLGLLRISLSICLRVSFALGGSSLRRVMRIPGERAPRFEVDRMWFSSFMSKGSIRLASMCGCVGGYSLAMRSSKVWRLACCLAVGFW